jgi:hypothetical protein
MKTVDMEDIQCAVQERYGQNKSWHKRPCGVCTVHGQGIYCRCHLSDGEQEVYWWGRMGGACVGVCVCGGGSVDFTFTLSEVSGPPREHTASTSYACVAAHVL